jgi:hypothetical protein
VWERVWERVWFEVWERTCAWRKARVVGPPRECVTMCAFAVLLATVPSIRARSFSKKPPGAAACV